MKNKNTGFTLIEVLIAMLVLAVGLLGLAGLQATSLNNNQRAYYRSQATILAYDIVDRMRANRSAVGNYLTSFIDPATAIEHINCLPVTLPIAVCSQADMAENDLFEWNREIIKLPQGVGTITVAAGVYTIDITWDEDRDGDDANNHHFQTRFRL
jgi:type IV pilus assembly protein PilV